MKHESLNQSGTLKEKTETKEPKVNIDVSKVLKRYFKIHGVVAGDNFKDGLSFVSLSRQIDAGLKAGYKENEIIDAVIRAVSPSLQLRSYLEMIQDLTLTRLRLIITLTLNKSRELNFIRNCLTYAKRQVRPLKISLCEP